jgi:hypothetical protein
MESESTVNVATSDLQRTLRVLRARRLQVPAVAIGVVVLAAACGGGSSNKSSTQTGSVASQGAAPNATPSTRPGTSGTISAVNPTNIFVQNTQAQSQTTVNFTASTTFSQSVTTTAAALKVGDCVTATAATPTARPSARPSATASRAPVTALTATNVMITATSGSCTRAGGFGGGNPSARPSFRPSARPSGAARGGGFGGAAFGTVGSVSNGSFVVNSTRGSSTTKVTVTTSASTVYREDETATKANLKVGLCATAIGTTDETGAVTARTIALSTPTSSGCTTGFGGGFGRGRFGGGAGGAGNGGGSGG